MKPVAVNDRMWACLDVPAYWAAEKLDQYTPAGLKCFFTGPSNVYYLGWDGGSLYHYEEYEAHIARLVRARPELQLVLWVGSRVGAPHKWCRENEPQLARSELGEPVRAGSLASDVWRRDSSNAIARFVEHFEAGPFASNIAGYNPVNVGFEWRGLGETRDSLGIERGPAAGLDVLPGDYSEPMRTGFRRWLEQRYGSTEALNAAWRSDLRAFADVDLPTRAERHGSVPSVFASECGYPVTKVVDYYRYFNTLNASMAVAWAEAIRQSCRGHKLVAITHGQAYPTVGRFHGLFPLAHGYAERERVYGCDSIDVVHATCSGYNRGSEGACLSQHPAGSLRLRGKRCLVGIDLRTHIQNRPRHADTFAQSRQLMIRDAATALATCDGVYWFDKLINVYNRSGHPHDFERLTYDDPALRQTVAELASLPTHLSEGGPHPEIALIRSGESLYEHGLSNDFEDVFVAGLRHWVMPRLGAPFDEYLLDDIGRIDRPYRCYIFPDALRVPAALREKIHAKLGADQATAVWFYGPGYIGDGGPDSDNCGQLIGIPLERHDRRSDLQIRPTGRFERSTEFGGQIGSAFFEKGCMAPAHDFDGSLWPSAGRRTYAFAPVFSALPGEGDVDGVLIDLDRPGIVTRRGPSFTSVWIGGPMPPPDLLRSVAEGAGVHLYGRLGDVVSLGHGLLVHTTSAADSLRPATPPGWRLTELISSIDAEANGAAPDDARAALTPRTTAYAIRKV